MPLLKWLILTILEKALTAIGKAIAVWYSNYKRAKKVAQTVKEKLTPNPSKPRTKEDAQSIANDLTNMLD